MAHLTLSEGRASLKREGGRWANEAELMAFVELLFFAYRDFTSDPDQVLAPLGFGRAHHRVLHFVERYPGLRVADLLTILKITKQSLSRVLGVLIEKGFITQEAGESDRRERRLYTTPKGRKLARELAAPQMHRISAALRQSGLESPDRARAFLYNMVSPEERDAVSALMRGAARAGDGNER
ncbi:MAG: MarR family transcriptional regulator [Hyphomicrobiaceae bacterium]|nr:MAG: MarR family transcriptional regulator [Hyphomicrobiaceae bacterium]